MLVPRPETEVVVTVALAQLDRICALPPGPWVLVVDLGTGSGVIALSLVVERPSLRVIGVDRDAAALEVAAINLAAIAAEPAAREHKKFQLEVIPILLQLKRQVYYLVLTIELMMRLVFLQELTIIIFYLG